jgi:hypothetical protein
MYTCRWLEYQLQLMEVWRISLLRQMWILTPLARHICLDCDKKKENYFVFSRIIVVAIAQYTPTSVVSSTCLLTFHHRFYWLSLFISRKLGCWLAYTAEWFICACCFISFSSLKHGPSMWKVKHLSVLMRGNTICNSVFVGIAAIYQFSTMDMCMACVLTSTLMLSLQKR